MLELFLILIQNIYTICTSMLKLMYFPLILRPLAILVWSHEMNCPVAISNHPSSKEINGNAALYFNPNNINDITNILRKITFNKKIINNLKKEVKELKIFRQKSL